MINMPTGCIMADIQTLVPYAKNPKNHNDKDVNLIVRSIKRNGWGDPLLVCPETMEILSGNGRLMAAKKLDIEQVPVVYAPKGLTEKQKADFVIASNKLVEVSGYNDNLDILLAEFGFDAADFGIEVPDMETDMPKLKDGDKSPFQQITFTLADTQMELVKEAIEKAKANELFEKEVDGNENSNGNALYVLALRYVNE